MSEERNALQNVNESIESSVSSSFNTGNTYMGPSNNNQTTFNINYNTNGEPTNQEIPTDLPITPDQKDVKKKVITFNQKIMESIWTFLNTNDKFNCTLVCKTFNKFISDMNYFRLIIDKSQEHDYTVFGFRHDKLTRSYKKVTFENFIFLAPTADYTNAYNTVSHLSRVANDVRFITCYFSLIKLYTILQQFSMLESLELNINIKDENFDLTNLITNLPKMTQLKIQLFGFNDYKFFEIFPLSNIQSLSFNKINLSSKRLDIYLTQHKSSLRSLTLKNCLFSLQSVDFLSSFDSLHELKELYLIDNSFGALEILNTECIDWLSDLEFFYDSFHYNKSIVNEFFKNYLWKKEIYDLQLSEYGFPKGPIVTNTKCKFPENIKTTFYHLHHCDFKYSYKNNEWESIPVTKPNIDIPRDVGRFSCLSIQVRDNLKDYKEVKDIRYVKTKNGFNKKLVF